VHDLKTLREQPALLREAMARRQKLDQYRPLLDRADTLEPERRTLI
jgi:seryl-tRNA synthetase